MGLLGSNDDNSKRYHLLKFYSVSDPNGAIYRN